MKTQNYYRELDHNTLFHAIKEASSADAKVDALADLVYKIVINDLKTLEERVSKLESFMWKCVGVISAVVVVANILARVFIK